MPQYPIPQFIENEGKIVFFLTFKQFFMLVGGGFTCIAFFFLLPFTLFAIGSVVVLAITFIVAFLKINDTSVAKLFLNYFQFSTGAKNYTWKKERMPYPTQVKKEPETNVIPSPSSRGILPLGKLKEAKKIVELQERK